MESKCIDGNSSDNCDEKWTEIKKTRKKSSTEIKLTNKVSDLNENQSAEDSEKQSPSCNIDKTLFIPSIYLHDADYYQKVLKDIEKYVTNEFSIKLVENTFKIMLTDKNDFEIITGFYKKMKISFHTCRCPTDQKLAVAIKGIPHSLTIEELTNIIQKNFPLITIQRISNKSKKPTSTCYVELVNNRDGREILNLEYIYYTKVTVEIWRMDNKSQCKNCQKYLMKRKPKNCLKSENKQQPVQSCTPNMAENTIENTKCNFCESYHKDFMLCPYYEKLCLKMDHKTIDFHSNKNEMILEAEKHGEREADDKIAEILREYNIDSNVNQQSLVNDKKTVRKENYEEENVKKIFNESMACNQTIDKQNETYPGMVWLILLVCGIYYLLQINIKGA